MTSLDRRGVLVAIASFTLFTCLAPDVWRNSIGWYGFGAIVAVTLALSIVLLVRHRRAIRRQAVPRALIAFLTLASLSIAWSAYPTAAAIGVTAQFVTTTVALAPALVLTAAELLRALGFVLRAVLGLSLLFELGVSLFVRAPVLPVWATVEDRLDPPKIMYWSRDLLFDGAKIQGILGSSTLLAMIALIALIVFGVQLASGSVRRITGVFWVAFAAVMIVITRSAAVQLAAVAVAVVLAAILLMRRAPTARSRRATSLGVLVGIITITALVVALRNQILAALNKSSDFTGRFDIWDAVIGLAVQRPVFGWGWVSFWPPWVEPFTNLIRRNGVMQLHAHNAWLDVWLQLGIIGVLVFAVFIASTAARSWVLATDPVIVRPGDKGVFTPTSLLAPLLLTALLVQSLAESRLLIEGGWVLLVIIATTTKLDTIGRLAPPHPADDRLARERT